MSINKIKNLIKKFVPPSWIKRYHKLEAEIAVRLYAYPSRKMVVIGVTGTNGKTTTSHLIASIFETAGLVVGMLTTTTFKIGKKKWLNKTKLTTLSPFVLQKMLARMVSAGCEYVVLEVSTHAVDQYRILGVDFDLMVLTNVTREHIEYHGSFKEYLKAKGELFRMLGSCFRKKHIPKVIILNRDEANFKYFDKFDADRKYTYGILRGRIKAERINYSSLESDLKSDFLLSTPLGNKRIGINLPGRFNIYNALAAATVAISRAIDVETIKNGLERVKNVPGRMEMILARGKLRKKQKFKVIVDYAHTPDALSKVFETLRSVKKNRIIVLLGACGERDKDKRPVLGRLASQFADIVIITNEDPYSEDPRKIIDEVAAGVKGKKKGKNFFKIFNRRQAIKKAIELSQENDIVLLTGKGAEQAIVEDGVYHPWDERKVVRKILEEKLRNE